jgi:hypothetical protein
MKGPGVTLQLPIERLGLDEKMLSKQVGRIPIIG